MESVADVLDEIVGISELSGLRVASPEGAGDCSGGTPEDLRPSERTVLDAVGHDPVTLDQLVGYTGMTSDRLAPTLVALEIDGWIETLPGSRFVRTAGRSR